MRAELDQVVAVGAVAVQEHHELLGPAALGFEARSGQFGGHFGVPLRWPPGLARVRGFGQIDRRRRAAWRRGSRPTASAPRRRDTAASARRSSRACVRPGRFLRLSASRAASCNAKSPAGKASGWPRQNNRKMSAVQGPTPLTATSARCASGAGMWASAARSRPCRATACAAAVSARIFGPERPQARRPVSPASNSACGGERVQRRFQPTEDRRGAGDRDLLRDDDRGEPGETRRAQPERRRSADLDEQADRLAVERQQRGAGFGERFLAVDQATRLVAQRRRRPSARLLCALARALSWPQPCRSSVSRRRPTGRSISATPIPPSETPIWRRGSTAACCCASRTPIPRAVDPNTRTPSSMI